MGERSGSGGRRLRLLASVARSARYAAACIAAVTWQRATCVVHQREETCRQTIVRGGRREGGRQREEPQGGATGLQRWEREESGATAIEQRSVAGRSKASHSVSERGHSYMQRGHCELPPKKNKM